MFTGNSFRLNDVNGRELAHVQRTRPQAYAITFLHVQVSK